MVMLHHVDMTDQYVATDSYLTTPLRSALGILDKYLHMLMLIGLMENRFDRT